MRHFFNIAENDNSATYYDFCDTLKYSYNKNLCGDIRLILRLRIDHLFDFRSTVATEYGQREESLAEWGELGVLSSHHCSVTLIVTVKLLGLNKLVRPLTQADILSIQC